HLRPPPTSTPFPYTTLFRSEHVDAVLRLGEQVWRNLHRDVVDAAFLEVDSLRQRRLEDEHGLHVEIDSRLHPHRGPCHADARARSEEHTSELQSLAYLVCRL